MRVQLPEIEGRKGQEDAAEGNRAHTRLPVSPPSQSDARSICSSSPGYARSDASVFMPHHKKMWGREKAQLAPLPPPVAAVVQQLKNKPTSPGRPSPPFRLPPPGGALGVQFTKTSPSSSPERASRADEQPAAGPHLRFSWDAEFEQYLRNKVGQTGAFIGAMSQSPTSPDAVYEPTERSSVIWFRDNYPEPPPAHRRDVFAVQHWLEGQMLKLEHSLQQQGLLHKQQQAQAAQHKQEAHVLKSKEPLSLPKRQGSVDQPPTLAPAQQQQQQQQSPEGEQEQHDTQGVHEQGELQGEGHQQGEQHGEHQQPQHEQHQQGHQLQEQQQIQQQQQQHIQQQRDPHTLSPREHGDLKPRTSHAPSDGVQGSVAPQRTLLRSSSPSRPQDHVALSDDGRSSVQVMRDSEGFLSTEVLTHQEQLFTRCMEELCGQAATMCVERGHLMWQLWAALRHMLRLVLQDRETSRVVTREARRSELSVKGIVEAEKAVTLSEMEEVTHMNEVLNRRVLSRQAEIDVLRLKITELEAHIASQANFNPAQMQQQIDELQVSVSIFERQVQNQNMKNDIIQRDLNEAQREVQYLTNKLSEARSDYTSMRSKLAVRTPRPHQPRMPPWELIKEEETIMAQQALREGCSPKDMHRLMLGVSFTNCNILPWINTFMGCCRSWAPAVKGAEDGPGLPEALESIDDAFSVAPSSTKPGTGHGRNPSITMHSRAGSVLAGGAATRTTGRKSKIAHPVITPIKELQPQLSKLLSSMNVTRMLKSLSPEVVQAVSQMANHGVDADSMACLLLGSVSPNGAELTGYKALAGILAERFGGTADDIGGPLTEALVMASMSTKERMEHLEKQLLQKHRMAVKFRRAVAEQRKQVDDMREHELKQQARKVTCTPHPLTHLLSQKRTEFFMGLGTDPSVPLVLQHEGKVYCRNLEKGEAEKTVNTIWQGKREFERMHNVSVSLPDYMYVYLHRKFAPGVKAITEGAYNLLYTLSKHTYDPDCCIFLKVFMNEVGEDIRDAQDGLKKTFLEALKRIDQETNVKATGWLLKNDMRVGLRKSFKDKTEQQLTELFDALDSDEPKELVNYYRLFDSDNDLNQGVFAETIRQQHLYEQLDFYQRIEDAILDHIEKTGGDVCTPQILGTALKKAHPGLSPEDAEVYQRRVFPNKGDKGKKASAPLDDALRLLRTPQVPRLVDANTALDLLRQGATGTAANNGPTHLKIGIPDTQDEEEDQEEGHEGNASPS